MPHCLRGTGQCNSCNALPRCLGIVSSGTPVKQCLTAFGGHVWCRVAKALLPQGNGADVYPRIHVNGRAVCLSTHCVLVCCCAPVTYALSHLDGNVLPTPVHGHKGSMGVAAPRVLCCTVSILCAVPHCLALCSTLYRVCLAELHLWALGSGQQNIGKPTASLLPGSGQWSLCNTSPHRLKAVCSGEPAMHGLTSWGQWAVEHLLCTASLLWGQWAVELLLCTASLLWRQWAVELPHGTATMPGRTGQWNSCHALSHCLGAVGGVTLVQHCLTASAGLVCCGVPKCRNVYPPLQV